MREVPVSDEYLETICEWMIEWSKKEDSLVFPQFLEANGIGFPYFKYFTHVSQQVFNTFEIVKSVLCARWVMRAMTSSKMPAHQCKVMMKYIRIYDTHALDIEREMKISVAAVEKEVEIKFIADNYANAKLDRDYQKNYSDNTDQRRSGEKS